MEYKDYLIHDGKVIEKGDSSETTKGIKLNDIQNIEKVRLPKRKLFTLSILTAVILGTVAALPDGYGVFAPPITELVLLGSFLLIVANVASLFVTDRYAIKGRNETIVLAAKGAKGDRFLREIHQSAGPHADSDLNYGTDTDPFTGSASQKKMNVAMVLLIVAGSALAIGFVAPMYSDNISWEEVTDVVEMMDDDNPEEVSGVDELETVYEETDESPAGETFTSEFTTVEFSQGSQDLDDVSPTEETYVNIDVTVHDTALMGVMVEIPESDVSNNVNSFAMDHDEDGWMDYTRLQGEFDTHGVIPTMPSNEEEDEYINETQRLSTPTSLAVEEWANMEDPDDRFVKGYIPGEELESDEFNPEEFEEPEPEVVGFEQGDTVRVTGTLPTQDGLLDVVLADYTVE